MASGANIALFGAAFTVSILSMVVTVSDDMCTAINRFGQNNYTFTYSPDTHELKKCCCTLWAADADVSVSISSNATFFELVFHTNGTVKSLRNETVLSLSNSIQFCGNKSESGFVILTGNKEFQVTCISYTSVIVSKTVNVPLTSTREESVTSNTVHAASGTATIPDDPKKHNINPSPPSVTHVQNESTTVSQNEKPGDEKGFSSIVIGIIIGSVTGVIVIIIGVVISCLVYVHRSRHRKPRSETDNDVTVSESHTTYCGLTVGDTRVYDHIGTPHQDKDYYNVPENSDYQNP